MSAAGLEGPGRLRAALRQRCPKCLEGRVFRGLVTMNESCPSCGHRFEREPGYFTGAMYVSYAMAVPAYALPVVLLHLFLPDWPDARVLGAALAIFLPFVPLLFRYSRIFWMHFDWLFDPSE
jgi:uncharacterized protein (DUF983 family)